MEGADGRKPEEYHRLCLFYLITRDRVVDEAIARTTLVLFFHCHRLASSAVLLGPMAGMEGRVVKGTLLGSYECEDDLNLLPRFLGCQHLCHEFQWLLRLPEMLIM